MSGRVDATQEASPSAVRSEDGLSGSDEPSLAFLIERSSDLKGDLVDFACSPRFERHLSPFLARAVGPGGKLDQSDAINVIDRFALQYRLPAGKTVLEVFVASRRNLSASDRELLRGWGDPVEGIFEVRGTDGDAIVLLNLIDDLEYRAYSNMGPVAFRPLSEGAFVSARLVPIRPLAGAWLVSGAMTGYPESSAAEIAESALEVAVTVPELVYRNPERLEQGWALMRADRAAFMEFFGGDELVLPPAEAEERLNAYYRQRQQAALAARPGRRRPGQLRGVDVPAFEVPAEIADAETIGIIYDETDGFSFYNEYGMLRELFADPALAADKRYSQVLRGYLKADSIGPVPFRRLAAAFPENVDTVFRKVLGKPNFTWAEHGEALLRRRKPGFYDREPRPGLSVIGERLAELLGLREPR